MLFQSDGLDLEGMEGQIDLAVLNRDLRLIVFQDVRQSDALRRSAESKCRFRMGALSFKQADDHALTIFGSLDGLGYDAGRTGGDEGILRGERSVLFGNRNREHGLVESVGFLQDLGILGAANVGEERIGESIQASVAVRVGIVGALKQRYGHLAAKAGVAVLAVVKKRQAEVGLGKIHVLVGADFKFGLIPAGVAVRGTAGRTELDVVGGVVGNEVGWELGLQDLFVFLPVDFRLEIGSRAAFRQVDGLNQFRFPEGKDEADALAGAVLDDGSLNGLAKVPAFFGGVVLDLPVVVNFRNVFVEFQCVEGLPLLHELAPAFLRYEGADAAEFVEGQFQLVVFQ